MRGGREDCVYAGFVDSGHKMDQIWVGLTKTVEKSKSVSNLKKTCFLKFLGLY